MLDDSPKAVLDLRTRTRSRNRAIWTPMFGTTSQALDEATLNALYLDTIEAPVAITDEVMAVKEYERDQQHAISQQQVALELQMVLDGFGFIQSKLTDLYALWQIKDRIVGIKIKNAADMLVETNALLVAEQAGEALHLTAMQNEQYLLAYEKAKTQDELLAEAALKNRLLAAREALQNVNLLTREEISNLRVEMEIFNNAAKRWLFLHQDHVRLEQHTTRKRIGKF